MTARTCRLANGTWVVSGRAYLCAFQDVCTKCVLGWQVRGDMSEVLVTSDLQRVMLTQRPAAGLIIHSDCGRTR